MARGYQWKMPWSVVDSFKNIKANLKDGYQFGDISAGWYGFAKDRDDSLKVTQQDLEAPSDIMGELESMFEKQRQEFLEDRQHTEEREDTQTQRGVADAKAAGLNPYTIGATAVQAPSSQSSVGSDTIQTKLQYLGYVLDLKNLDLQNKKFANSILGNVLRVIGYAS